MISRFGRNSHFFIQITQLKIGVAVFGICANGQLVLFGRRGIVSFSFQGDPGSEKRLGFGQHFLFSAAPITPDKQDHDEKEQLSQFLINPHMDKNIANDPHNGKKNGGKELNGFLHFHNLIA
jgi:hypothetical protein